MKMLNSNIRWISFNEENPPELEEILVVVKTNYGKYEENQVDMATTDINGEIKSTYNDWYEGQKIEYTHWSLLPEPPET